MRPVILMVAVIAACGWSARADADDKKVCSDAYIAAQTLRDAHKLVEARDQMRTCARQACAPFMKGDMVQECTTWLSQVEAAMPSVVFEVKDGSGNDLSGVHVTIDSQPFADHLDGTALAVDPGEHRFVFVTQDGSQRREKVFVIHEGDKQRRERIVLGEPAPQTSPPPAASAPAGEATSGVPASVYVAFGVGAAGLVVGGMFTGFWFGENSKCSQLSQDACDQKYTNHESTLSQDTAVLVAGYGVGAAGVGLGLLFLVNSSSKASARAPHVTPRIGLGWAGIEGSF